MRSLVTLLLVFASFAGPVARAAEPVAKAPLSRTLEARGRRVQATVYAAMDGLERPTSASRGGVGIFLKQARVAWAGLPHKELQGKVQRLSWLQEGAIEAAIFPRTARYRRAGLSSLGAMMEEREALKDVPIDRLLPPSFVARLQRRWRSIALTESRRDLERLGGARRFPLRSGVSRTLEGHLVELVRELEAQGRSPRELRGVTRQLATLRSALAGMVRPDGTLDRAQLDRAGGVVQFLFQSSLTRSRNDLANELSNRIYHLRAVAISFPGERIP